MAANYTIRGGLAGAERYLNGTLTALGNEAIRQLAHGKVKDTIDVQIETVSILRDSVRELQRRFHSEHQMVERSILKDETVVELRNLRRQGISLRALCARVNFVLSEAGMSRLVSGHSYKKVPGALSDEECRALQYANHSNGAIKREAQKRCSRP